MFSPSPKLAYFKNGKLQLSRRSLLKHIVTTSGVYSLASIGIDIIPRTGETAWHSCSVCDFGTNKLFKGSYNLQLPFEHCPNCGAENFKKRAGLLGQCICDSSKKITSIPVCSYVPFPQREVAMQSGKPSLDLTSLRF
jgi:hypothetical protein